MEFTVNIVVWIIAAALVNAAAWFLTHKRFSVAGRGILRSAVAALALAPMPVQHNNLLPALLFLLDKQLFPLAAVTILLTSMALFCVYWFGLLLAELFKE